mmetsp:Transcript_4337/g.6658  ORF Transcript_4337/g.6658 Transcript_4337/m.6658 type:complete len:98 (+) Transcript_4337:43-336(+)|eukprot:CAMPEP_0185024542 /NCGR_PEP_ID=MMETSP1103-20130426/7655_1 /TAXON_ID=36769 /ORGANISM="Paraphysomonas bandaiensis, Strain Caron Lab Isolate" /LENGTH=97 /DNA_ID=CAMNT_0027557541 /DNA_START=27 /DNA_END=320 /DNA_ORIENTATION=+
MASGFGLSGGASRCFQHFQDFNRCVEAAENPTEECPKVMEDYFECLHGFKQVDRAMAVKVMKREKELEAGEHQDNSGWLFKGAKRAVDAYLKGVFYD